MPKSALVFFGGWDGHQPKRMAEIFRDLLTPEGFSLQLHDRLECLTELDLPAFDLIIPMWTMGKISKEQLTPLAAAIENGTGLAGCHGGMCDAFRESTTWQFITGGQWVAHPGGDGVDYTIHITDPTHPLTAGLADFPVKSEQYYMHVDPAVHVLATTRFPTAGVDGPHLPNGEVLMPQAWTKYFGRGRIFYSALGHAPEVLDIPEARELLRRGLLWAAR